MSALLVRTPNVPTIRTGDYDHRAERKAAGCAPSAKQEDYCSQRWEQWQQVHSYAQER